MGTISAYDDEYIRELRASSEALREANMRMEGEVNYWRSKCERLELEVQKLTKIVRAVEVLCGGKILDR